MTCNLVIGVDCSSTAAKAVVWNTHGRAVAEGREPIAHTSPHRGWGEQDPAEWWRAVVKALEAASRQVDAKRVAALSIAHQRETFVCLDAKGQAIRPAIMWLDGQAAEYGDELVQAHLAEKTRTPGPSPNPMGRRSPGLYCARLNRALANVLWQRRSNGPR